MRFIKIAVIGFSFVVTDCFTLAHAGKREFPSEAFSIAGALPSNSPAPRSRDKSSPSFQPPIVNALFSFPNATNDGDGRRSYRAEPHRTVSYNRALPVGSIVINTRERKLYYILGGGKAIQYAVGVGREGFTWSGIDKITRKAEWPDWRPPQIMIEREAARGVKIPVFMAGGPENPLGARALYIGSTEYRIHGTSAPWTIGMAVSSGCIRMMNNEVIDLYKRTKVGAQVIVE